LDKLPTPPKFKNQAEHWRWAMARYLDIRKDSIGTSFAKESIVERLVKWCSTHRLEGHRFPMVDQPRVRPLVACTKLCLAKNGIGLLVNAVFGDLLESR
jgi:hypothetical protein